MRKSMLLAAVSCCTLLAQAPKPTDVFEKAPPEIDSALRANIDKFFQSHVEGKFRQAEEVVAEDSKDFFYNMEKQRYLGYEIVKINYSENFTKATVITAVEVEWRTARMGVMRVKPPMTTLWKVENGKWVWYVVPQKDWETPWGKMKPGPDDPQKVAEMFKGVSLTDVVRKVQVDKGQIRLSSFQPSKGEATLSNEMPGEVRIRMSAPPIPGLVTKIDKTTLQAGEKAHITVDYNPPTKEPKSLQQISLYAEPINQTFRIDLIFDIPEELKKQLPAALQKK